MAESSSTCFLTSFSQPPSPKLEVNQGDPVHALSSSVSFGRYMSESMAWEKWSTFSHNRYKEEAERYSRPGSVAEMKAYFEAHYKKKAAERAAAVNGQQNSENNLKMIRETRIQNCSVMDQGSVAKDSHACTGETCEEVVANGDVAGVSLEMSRCTPSEKGGGAKDAQILNDGDSLLADPVATHNQQNLVEDIQLCESTPKSERKGLEHTPTVKADEPQFADCVDVQDPVRDAENIGIDAANLQNKMPINDAGRLGEPGSLDKEKLAICSTKSRSRTGVPKPPVLPKLSVSLQKRRQNDANLHRKGTAGVPKPPVPPKPPVFRKMKHNHFNLDPKGTSGVPKPPIPPKQSVPLQKGKHNNANLDREETAGVPNPPVPPKMPISLQKKKHNNANLDRKVTSGVQKPPVPPKQSVSLQKGKHNNANLDREGTVSLQIMKHNNANLDQKGNAADMADRKRTTSNASKVSHGKPVRDSVEISPDAADTFQEKKVSGSKSPGACGREARPPPTITRALIFKSEQRAAKRKEFFERLEQKAKVKMTEKEKLQEQTKIKAINDPKSKSEYSKTSSNAMKKVSMALPCSSKLQDISSQLPSPTTTIPCSASATRTPSKLQDNNIQSPWRHSALTSSSSADTKTPSKLQDNNSRSPWRHSTLASSSSAGTKTPSKLQDNNSRSPWRRSTLACSSSAGTKTPSKLQDNNSRSPWRYSTVACSSSAGTKTPSKLQDDNSRSPWRQSTLACSYSSTKTPSKLQDNIGRSPCSSSVDQKTPSKLQDNDSRSPRRQRTLVSSSSVDRKTPSRVQDSNSRPPWRLAAKSPCYQETTEKNKRSPFHPGRSRSKKSAHENSSPNIPLSRES